MGLLVLSGDYGTERHLIPGGNNQAVDQLDTPMGKSPFEVNFATQMQPALRPASSNRSEYSGVTVGRVGVSDGFRTRDLRIHNPAL